MFYVVLACCDIIVHIMAYIWNSVLLVDYAKVMLIFAICAGDTTSIFCYYRQVSSLWCKFKRNMALVRWREICKCWLTKAVDSVILCDNVQ